MTTPICTPYADSCLASELAPYAALARIALQTHTPHPWEHPLSCLLHAAAQGMGHIAVAAVCPAADHPDSETFLASRPQHLIALAQTAMTTEPIIMLARIAGAWSCVRTWVEHAVSERLQYDDIDDMRIASELTAILPPLCETDSDSAAIIFDNAHQRLAVATLIDSRFAVLTGGPGTGKTTSAAAFLALRKRLQPQLQATDILVCAPTGKAANRLQQSLRGASAHLHLNAAAGEDTFLNDITPITIHRALGWTPKSAEDGGPFRFQKNNPLPYKLVLMDESSMCDVELMAQLIRALPADCALILLGDRDQLDSVEAGGVLAELVLRGSAAAIPDTLCAAFATRCGVHAQDIQQWRTQSFPHNTCPVDQQLPAAATGLYYSWRARNAPWVLDLAAAVRPNSNSTYADISDCFKRHAAPEKLTLLYQQEKFTDYCSSYWQHLHQLCATWTRDTLPQPAELDTALQHFQLLCATNEQVRQANTLGCRLAWGAALHAHQPHDLQHIPHGCPILIEANQHNLNLSNGDIGIAIGAGTGTPAQWAIFPGHPQPFSLAQLPTHRPAYGLTIHKSQGSEWKNIAIALPTSDSDMLDRHLIYTAITRSSGSVCVHASTQCLKALVE